MNSHPEYSEFRDTFIIQVNEQVAGREFQEKLRDTAFPSQLSNYSAGKLSSLSHLLLLSDQMKKRTSRDNESDSIHHIKKKTKLAHENDCTNNYLCGLDDSLSEENSFPKKLMKLLENGENTNVMWWLPSGDAFAIEPKQFAREVLQKSFQGTKFESFTRKLSRWGFKRIVGKEVRTNAAAFYHPCFRKGKPELLDEISGRKKKGLSSQSLKSVHVRTRNLLLSFPTHSKTTSKSSHYENPKNVNESLVNPTTELVLSTMRMQQIRQMEQDMLLKSLILKQRYAQFALQQRQQQADLANFLTFK